MSRSAEVIREIGQCSQVCFVEAAENLCIFVHGIIQRAALFDSAAACIIDHVQRQVAERLACARLA
jgi:hypothetical protein